LNYQHAAAGRDQEIASALDKLIKKERGKARGHGGHGGDRKGKVTRHDEN
jgi:hypothetical protein